MNLVEKYINKNKIEIIIKQNFKDKQSLFIIKNYDSLSTGRIESLLFAPVKFQELSKHDFSLLYKKLMITEDKNIIQKLTPKEDFTHYKDNHILIEDNKFFFYSTKFSSLL